MCRQRLRPDEAMLLRYSSERDLSIWMKNMNIPLDILFLDGQGGILALYTRVPPCTQPPCPLYRSPAPTAAVLELSAGSAQRLGLAPGQRLLLPPQP